jgi:chemotaxis protein MotB
MMTRRNRLADSHNHERWLVSYSDFMTLLFGFFVVMYAISSVNEGKYRVLSQSLLEVFPQRELTIEPIQAGQPAQSSAPSAITFEQPPVGAQGGKSAQESPAPSDATMQAVGATLREELAGLLPEGRFGVAGHDQWLEVNLDAAMLFASGEATLTPLAYDVVREIVARLDGLDNPITVEGYTDSVPIQSTRFPSNWELSAARAAAVARAFAAAGIDGARLAAVGYGEQHPVDTNATPEGRAANRRVTLIIPRDADAQRGLTTIGAARAAPIALEWRDEDAPATESNAVQAVRRRGGGILFTNEPPASTR